MNTFSGSESIGFAWEIFKKRPWFLVGATLLFMVVTGAVSFALVKIGMVAFPILIIATILRLVFDMLVGMGFIAFTLKAHDNINTVSLADFWHPQDFWKFLGAVILQILVIVAGVIALVIPGVMLSVALKFSPFFVIDKGAGPIESLFESARITRGNKWAVFQFLVLVAIINIAGVFALILGLFVTLPLTTIATAHAYRTLSKSA
jgi:uncharacterized membrane protein